MTQKIHQVREALERQTRVLEETHQKLELLSGRLTLMEHQSRVRELERIRVRRREEARLEDERWFQEWDALCASQRSQDASWSPSSMSFHEKQRPGESKEKTKEFEVSMAGYEMDLSVDEDDDGDVDELCKINSSFEKSCAITGVNGDGIGTSITKSELRPEEIQLPVIAVAPNGKERADPGL